MLVAMGRGRDTELEWMGWLSSRWADWMYGAPCRRWALWAREAAYQWLTASVLESHAWLQTQAPPLTWVIVTSISYPTSVCLRIFAFEEWEHHSHGREDNNRTYFIEWLWTSVIQQTLSIKYVSNISHSTDTEYQVCVRHCTRAWRCSKEQTPPCLCESYIIMGERDSK